MIAKYPKTQLSIVAEGVLERPLVRVARERGAQAVAVSDVRGVWLEGERQGAWEADRTVEIRVICDEAVADAIAELVLERYAPHYGVAISFAQVQVLRPERF